MTDSLTGAFKARGAFWLKCKKALEVLFQRPVDNYSGGAETSVTPFIIILDSKIHFLRVFFNN
jgi:hypothetical protein